MSVVDAWIELSFKLEVEVRRTCVADFSTSPSSSPSSSTSCNGDGLLTSWSLHLLPGMRRYGWALSLALGEGGLWGMLGLGSGEWLQGGTQRDCWGYDGACNSGLFPGDVLHFLILKIVPTGFQF